MAEVDKKYVVNIDFPTYKSEGGHKIHLNPYCKGFVWSEKVFRHYDPKKSKIPSDGGSVYLTRDEALGCLKGNRKIKWQGKSAYHFRACKICARLPDWDI